MKFSILCFAGTAFATFSKMTPTLKIIPYCRCCVLCGTFLGENFAKGVFICIIIQIYTISG